MKYWRAHFHFAFFSGGRKVKSSIFSFSLAFAPAPLIILFSPPPTVGDVASSVLVLRPLQFPLLHFCHPPPTLLLPLPPRLQPEVTRKVDLRGGLTEEGPPPRSLSLPFLLPSSLLYCAYTCSPPSSSDQSVPKRTYTFMLLLLPDVSSFVTEI